MNEALALTALQQVDFHWTRDLGSIWHDAPYDAPELNHALAEQVSAYFFRETAQPGTNPLGQVIVGMAGAGKTHLIGELRRRAWAGGAWFVLLDIVGITDFWPTTALGFLDSLHQRLPDGRTQYEALCAALCADLGVTSAEYREPRALIDAVLGALHRRAPRQVVAHADVVRAVLLLGAESFAVKELAYSWLQGLELDEADRRPLGLVHAKPRCDQIVRGLLWLMSLTGPTLIALDQIDAIVTASNLGAGTTDEPRDDSERRARAIIELLAGGLIDLHDLKSGLRALMVVSCLETTWEILRQRALQAFNGRFLQPPKGLQPLNDRAAIASLLRRRLEVAYAAVGFVPPYPTWPFAPSALDSVQGLMPRLILMRCDAYRQQCARVGAVSECRTLIVSETAPDTKVYEEIEREYQDLCHATDLAGLNTADADDGPASDLLYEMCKLYVRQFVWPETIDVKVQGESGQKMPPLHARLSFTFRHEHDREQHYCLRVLEHTHATAFQSRLKAAMTAAGIDQALDFRHLFIFRRAPVPSGPVTAALLRRFVEAGGRLLDPSADDWRAFSALHGLAQRHHEDKDFDAWLRQRQPLCTTATFQAMGLCPPPFSRGATPRAVPADSSAERLTASVPSPAMPAAPAPPRAAACPAPAPAPIQEPERTAIPVGQRVDRATPVSLPVSLLPRHIAILAGAGSGKTVLLRRLVEEAALRGIPALVLDPNNDLSRLGDPWPEPPPEFSPADQTQAADYQARVEVVIWTPGVAGGNPLALGLLPDFAALGGDSEEIDRAVAMARETLAPLVGGLGSSNNAKFKLGVLSAALTRFAQEGGGQLSDLIALLDELPAGTSRVRNAEKFAAEMADLLNAALATNPLLQAEGVPLDPARLFAGTAGKTRVSVVNFAGLADAARDAFVNRLQMTLFGWIKRQPGPRLYVLDEAQIFAPAQGATACKESTLALAAQARKYGLGMIFATQTPKGIDNKIISNCTTHFYGRMSSPATLNATRELMAAKGGAADDLGRLSRGEFYFSTEGTVRPIKIRTPLCLSWHPANPPTAEEIKDKACAQREAMRFSP